MKRSAKEKNIIAILRARVETLDLITQDMQSGKPIFDKSAHKRYVDGLLVEIYEILDKLS